MNKKLLLLLILLLLQSYHVFADDTELSLITRAIGNTAQSKDGKNWDTASRGQKLSPNLILRTGQGSAMVLRFLDGTITRMQENTETQIAGNREAAEKFKLRSVEISLGNISFDVKHRPDKPFKLSCATSVAAIKGTEGVFESGIESSKLLILSSPSSGDIAEFKSLLTGKVVTVLVGQVAMVDKNGQVTVRPMTASERKAASKLVEKLKSDNATGLKAIAASEALRKKIKDKKAGDDHSKDDGSGSEKKKAAAKLKQIKKLHP
jgi:hypothetical protein